MIQNDWFEISNTDFELWFRFGIYIRFLLRFWNRTLILIQFELLIPPKIGRTTQGRQGETAVHEMHLLLMKYSSKFHFLPTVEIFTIQKSVHFLQCWLNLFIYRWNNGSLTVLKVVVLDCQIFQTVPTIRCKNRSGKILNVSRSEFTKGELTSFINKMDSHWNRTLHDHCVSQCVIVPSVERNVKPKPILNFIIGKTLLKCPNA